MASIIDNWREYYRHLKDNEERILNCFEIDYFDNSSKSQLVFYYELFKSLLINNEELALQNIMKVTSMKDYNKIKCLELIGIILNVSIKVFSEHVMQSILQLASNLSSENERDISYYSTKILCSLIDSKYQEIVLYQLSNLMDFANVFSRKLIVEKLLPFKKNNKQIETILLKAQLDRNYYIRKTIEDHIKTGTKTN